MSYKLYPIIKNELRSNDYSVKINGEAVELDTARVSAVPFNHVWPGHQRPMEQSEVVQFLSLAIDEPIEFEITPNMPFGEVKIRPRSLGITPKITEDGKIVFTLDRPAYFSVEAYGRNHALHIFADPMPTYEVDIDDPNVLYFGAGEHDVGLIELQSNQTLFIDEGAVVYARIHAIDSENIKILGRGILDNSRNKEIILYEPTEDEIREGIEKDESILNCIREHTVQLEYCNNIEIDGITIRDSLVYNVRPVGCENIKIKHVKIIGNWRYNSDGIDMHNCVNVHISKCFIRTFDDCICMKGMTPLFVNNWDEMEAKTHEAMYRNGKAYDVFKNVLVEDCVIWNDWGKCLEIGAETRAKEFCNITFRNCDLIHLTGPALDCMNVDYADVHDITYTDINIEADEIIPKSLIQKSVDEVYVNHDLTYIPQTIWVHVTFHHQYSAGGTHRGRNRNMVFKNIHVFSDKMPRVRMAGYDEEHKTENILISNLCLNGEPLSELPEKNWEIGDFTDNIRLEADQYTQMDKNNVSSKGQLRDSAFVRLENPNGKGARVMFVGNSITLHDPCPEIGWYGQWGMAASSKEKDYVHLLEAEIRKHDPNAAFCICQVAEWERGYKNGSEQFPCYAEARKFGADIIIFRFIENVAKSEYEAEAFRRELDRLAQYLDGTEKANFIVTTGFWKHPADEALRAFAAEKEYPCIELGDLGEDNTTKAIGLFEHGGVAHHPGDKGMQIMANRIMESLLGKHYIRYAD